jgi:Oxidoreductase family, NAD-binding Rossmann fold
MADVSAERPRTAQTGGPLWFVVEGVGDVIRNFYDPAFRALRDRQNVRVTFADDTRFWGNDLSLASKMRGIIDSVRSWGAEYLDKSQPADLETYNASTPEVVIIATPDFTHVKIAESWLRKSAPPQIFIEKPLAASLSDARRLLGSILPYNDRILAFDHYRARLLPSRHQMDALLNFLGRGVSKFKFYFLEDHSGADPTYPDAATINRDGPIENEQRVKTLNQGMLLDGMPHMIALLAHFARVETLRVTRIQAGQYVGLDRDPDKRTEIGNETFAAAEFVCADFDGNRLIGAGYVGKGVRGVRILGTNFDHNVKLLDIEGLNALQSGFSRYWKICVIQSSEE